MPSTIINSVTEIKTKRAPNKQYPSELRCCAYVKPDVRCSRPRKNDNFCGSHIRDGSIKFGIIDT